jgi:hypothetical protein
VTALPSAPNDSANSPLRQWWLMLLVVAVGIGLRCMQAFEDRALWLDEAMLALNVRRLSLTELCGPLQYDQAAPVGFLWLQKLASYVASDAEISARIVPWAAGCLGLILFAKLIFNTTGPVALLAVTAMAFSPTLICYSGEAKQYSLDVLCTVWALSAGLRWMQFPTRTSAVRAAILCAVAPWLSHAGVFFLPGVLLLAVVFRRHTGWPLSVGCALAVVLSVLTLYWVNIRGVHGNTALNNFWHSDYVPWKAIKGGPTEFEAVAVWVLRKWWELVVRAPGLAPAVPPATIAWFGVASVTIIVSWLLWCSVSAPRRSGSLLPIYMVLPVIACLAGAAVEIYPFGNRLLLFSAPLVFFLLGQAPLTETWGRLRRYQLDVLLIAMLLTWPVGAACMTVAEWKSVSNMFAPHTEEDIRPFVSRMKEVSQTQAGCYVFHAARPAYEFYSGDRTAGVVFGTPGDPDHHEAEVRSCLAQNPRCCFLYAHTAPWGVLEPCKAYEYLATQQTSEVTRSRDDVRFFTVEKQIQDIVGAPPTMETAAQGVPSASEEDVSHQQQQAEEL